MDSGNSSGSMQSSSGGDEEYDSRAESSSISAFLNNQQGHVVGPFTTTTTSNEAPNTSSSHLNPLTHHTPMFDHLSSYLDPIQRSTTTLPNPTSLDMMWSKAGRSEPNQPDLGALMQLGGQSVAAFPTTQHSLPPQGVNSRGLLLDEQAHNNSSNSNNNNNNNNSNMVRNPKKRSRASRRAPTTVLTTDTTNFRAMVQEFTGIPAPPFTSSSPFPRTRLDLFGSGTPPSSTIRSHLEPPYLLRPFPQKVQPFPHQSTSSSIPSSSFPLSSSSSSMVDSLLVPNNNSSNSCASLTSTNYQQVSSSVDHHLGLLKQHHQQQQVNVNSMHNNPIFSFQSILQAPQPRYPLGNNSLHLASKTQPSLEIPQTSTIDSSLRVGVLEELGLSHAHVNTQVGGLHHQNVVHSSSDGALSRVNNNNSSSMGRVTNNDGGDHGGGVILRSLSGSGNLYSGNIQERVSNGKVNYTVASPSDFHGEKGPECGVAAAARSEGMVESWINCSSD